MSKVSIVSSSISDQTPVQGVTYWRSLEQLENSPEFQQIVAREFPEDITEAPDAVSRRGFLSAVAATVALAGMTSCRKPVTNILPFNKRPEGYKPGIPQVYATTLTRGGVGIGVLVKSSDGRPIKIEGNPDHPSSLGGSDARLQAELLQIYDPGRSNMAIGPSKGEAHAEAHGAAEHGAAEHAAHDPNETFTAFYEFWETTAKELLAKKGAGLHMLLPKSSSPSLLAMIGKARDAFPEASFYMWDALHHDEELAGAKAAFGKAVETHVDYSKSSVVVSFDNDFLALDGNNLRNARDWAKTRRAPKPGADISRLYVYESCFSTTGTMADHRFRMTPSSVAAQAMALAAQLGVGATSDLNKTLAPYKSDDKNIAAIATDLLANLGKCAVVAGPRMPAAVHAIVHAINARLENLGKTVTFTTHPMGAQAIGALPESLKAGSVASIKLLAAALEQGKVEVLACIGTNPIYDAPADLQFGKLLHDKKAKHTIHVGLHRDETGQHCQWHFPMAHELESWGDAHAHDGTVSLQQPMIAPLHSGVSALEFVAFLAQQPNYESLVTARDTSYGCDLLRDYWKAKTGNPADFEAFWRRALHEGVVPNSAFAAEPVTLDVGGVNNAALSLAPKSTRKADEFELALRPCPKMWDGRYGNNSWMQELPDPLTKLTWDNALMISAKTARDKDIKNGDLLTITVGGLSLQIPAWILPGHADDCATIFLGWGRKLPEECRVARGTDDRATTGFDAFTLRTVANQWLLPSIMAKAKGTYRLVSTQDQGTMNGRAIVREATMEQHTREPDWAPMMSPLAQAAKLEGKTAADKDKSLWLDRFDPARGEKDVKKSPYQWGMVIDLNACSGCSACVIACVAENNIPMVGKTQVSHNREMFWIRADRYFSSVADVKHNKNFNDLLEMADDPQVANMPTPCMQCENAPCESVCPVAATTHSADGLNDMVYNRCIGTRYCSNNCPYKVRRFNFLDYLGQVPETKKMAFNPDVTVRGRGVMEKCTYCVQRINGGRIQAKMANKKVGDGPDDIRVTPACAQSCPTQAITFGNIIEPTSAVAQLRGSSLNYGVLAELHTRPRTTYLGRVRNPNPKLA
ncbi:molybdopterin oxidoreductase [Planctomycetota bacterium]|nr:TAT-variant-translocated molybdopterin oxidoreductase [Planctomycetota bacterium]GDY01794.1 molybdopterin oxidoreductase [Planctomycetota bacterium]